MKVIWGVLGLGAMAGLAISSSEPPKRYALGGFTTSLLGRSPNQRHNAELSMSKLRSIRLKPGATFSFNETVGTFTQDQGYRRAPVSYNGNLISSWGGGVCQTSTTVYNAGLLAGLSVQERHRHRFAPSYIAPGRDAAVAFNTIDLKLTNPYPFEVEIVGEVVQQRLRVTIWANSELPQPVRVLGKLFSETQPQSVEFGHGSGTRIRNSGAKGFEVAIFREVGGRRELVSHDRYPAMDRVAERYERGLTK